MRASRKTDCLIRMAFRSVTLCVIIATVGMHEVHAQQQTPPHPAELQLHRSIDASTLTVVKPDALNARLFKGVTLSPAQQKAVIGNLGGMGCSPMQLMQETMPTPPGLVSGDACRTRYSGTQQELLALRKVLTNLIQKNKASDVAPFEAAIPKDCPYKELYYYLDVLAQVTGAQ